MKIEVEEVLNFLLMRAFKDDMKDNPEENDGPYWSMYKKWLRKKGILK